MKWIFAAIFVGIALFLAKINRDELEMASQLQSKSLLGKTAVVVGGTNGIGAGIALRLAQAKASVTILGRSAERGLQVVADMKQAAAGSEAKFEFIPCDVFDLDQIRRCSETIRQQNGVLDLLVLTAGIATLQGRTLTKQGLDQKLTAHYYSRVLFTQELIPNLKASKDPRVLFVLSGGVHGAYAGYREDPELEKSYSLKNAADAAGFYTDIACESLSRENPEVTFIHQAPGFVKTAWGTELPALVRFAVRCIQPLGKSPATCAEFLFSSLTAEEHRGGFRILNDHSRPAKTTSLHDAAREFVWTHTRDVLSRK